MTTSSIAISMKGYPNTNSEVAVSLRLKTTRGTPRVRVRESVLHRVGVCLSSQGKFAAAQPWLERAVKAAEQGNIHGRVNHQNLAIGLNQVGVCLSSQGQFAAAQLWFERAVRAEKSFQSER